jgi:hypothetical protein
MREIVECRLSDMVGARVRQLLTCVGVHFATKPAFIHVGSNRQEMHQLGLSIPQTLIVSADEVIGV